MIDGTASTMQVPVGANLFTWPSDDPRLIGTHCKSCGDCFFPKIFTCPNPACDEKDVEDVILARTGKVFSHSTLHFPPPPPYVVRSPYKPIPIAEVELPEGVRIIGMMAGCEAKDLRIGMPVDIVFEKLYQDADGNEVVGWKFRPQAKGVA